MAMTLSSEVRSSPRLSAVERSELGAMAAFIAVLHVAGFALVALATHHLHVGVRSTFGIGTGILAYTLGMRHAFDADHLAAIDNTTRKLLDDGGRPLSVGFFFSLGHSSVVFALAAVLDLGIRTFNGAVSNQTSTLHQWTSLVGTSISGVFLYAISAINLVALAGIAASVRALKAGELDHDALEGHLQGRGLLNRLFGGVARKVDRPWKMYPIGLLFGLGFDTATEVGLLVLAGTAVVSGLPAYGVIGLPLCFAAGMCLLDTIDGCFMNLAYDWAFSNPARKLYYNLVMTGLSVAIALVIGTIELLGLVGTHTGLHGGVFGWAANLNLNVLGGVIVAAFVATWTVAAVVWRTKDFEDRWRVADTSPRREENR